MQAPITAVLGLEAFTGLGSILAIVGFSCLLNRFPQAECSQDAPAKAAAIWPS